MSDYQPFSADGHEATWTSWDGSTDEQVSIRWDNEAFTAASRLSGPDIEYIIRLSPEFAVRQFLLFRDLDEPDLWLGTDGAGRWGEVNGAHRPELDGHFDIAIAGSTLSIAVPIRRLTIAPGHAAELKLLTIDVDTLGITPTATMYSRVAPNRWRVASETTDHEFEVDEHGLPLDIEGHTRRA